MSLSLLFGTAPSLHRTLTALLVVGLLAFLDIRSKLKNDSGHYLFGCAIGTVLSIAIINFARTLLTAGFAETAQVMALGILLIFLGWELLFGPWQARVKATVLGTFLFWIAFVLIAQEPAAQRLAHVLATIVAAIPAVIWAALFLEYHRERMSVVFLMFFAGMASTVPILFYDALVKHGAELQFFFFRIVPESFGAAAQSFVSATFTDVSNVQSMLLTMLVSFLLVGLIEEASKYWVLRRSGMSFFSSIDDVMQLAIIVAIGFAFAENVTNTGYFLNFVKQYLVDPPQKDWVGFIGNVAGRSVLTSMVHIVSTGLLGYYFGVAIFAAPCLQEGEAQGRTFFLVNGLHRLLGFPKKSVFRTQMLLQGFFLAVLLHAFSNFMVTLPDVLPGNPRTLGELFQSPPDSAFHYFSLLLFPTLLYVVGGFWVLTMLFKRKENMKVRGHLVTTDTYVVERAE